MSKRTQAAVIVAAVLGGALLYWTADYAQGIWRLRWNCGRIATACARAERPDGTCATDAIKTCRRSMHTCRRWTPFEEVAGCLDPTQAPPATGGNADE